MTRVLVISARDNVGTAIEIVDAGSTAMTGEAAVVAIDHIPRGHKIALREIRAGEAVIKFGSPIGVATTRIPCGAHVHTHNVASTRGRGDLSHPAPSAEARLAEPPDKDMTMPDTLLPEFVAGAERPK